VLKNLTELSKDVARYQDELTKMRKRTKDVDTLEAINLIQTTTTCLQKVLYYELKFSWNNKKLLNYFFMIGEGNLQSTGSRSNPIKE
jgi:hypothetical protein